MDDRQRRLHEYDTMISSYRYLLALSPTGTGRSTPLHAFCVYSLAGARLACYEISRQQGDLEQSIFDFTEAIFLPIPTHIFPLLNIFWALSGLTFAISLRAYESRRPEDIKCCIEYLRYLRGQPHEVQHDVQVLFPVTEPLVRTLAIRAELEIGDVDQDIDEMADLCDELLKSDISTDSLTDLILTFAITFDHAHPQESFETRLPSEKVIGCLRAAIIRLPDLHIISILLANILFRRFFLTVSDDDYNEGMAILDKIINFCDPGDTSSPCRVFRQMALRTAVDASYFRFHISGKPEHLEKAIYVIRTLLDEMSLEDPSRDWFIKLLSGMHQFRFDGSTTIVVSHRIRVS